MDESQVPLFSHDVVFRESLKNKEVACDFFRAHLPPEVLNQIKLKTLEPIPRSFVDAVLREQESDVLYRVQTTDQKLCYLSLYLLVEHQSTPNYWMPFRVLEYCLGIWKAHREQNPGNLPLPPIFPLIYYHGTKSPYPYSLKLMDLFQKPEWVREFVFGSTQLVDLSQLTLEEIKNHPLSALLEWTQKYIRQAAVPEFLEGFLLLLRGVRNHPVEGLEAYQQRIFFYLSRHSSKESWNQIRYQLQKETLTKEEQQMISAAESFIQEGMEMGFEKGLSQGISQTQRELARKMVANGFSLKQIADCLDLPPSKIEALLDKKESASALNALNPSPPV